MMKKTVKETASVGSTGAHSIAAAPTRSGTVKKRTLKSYLVNFYSSLSNRLNLKPVNFYKLVENEIKVVTALNEAFNMDSVLAQLSSFENKTKVEDEDLATYGVEDDKGNLMKVTILATQADDFEAYISAYLSELRNFKDNGVDLEDMSLAELLYRLKDTFDIRDAEFPTIPDDIVYNADEASENMEDLDLEGEGMMDEEGMDDFDLEGEGDMEGMEGDMDFDASEFDEFDLEGEEGEEDFDEFTDDESVEDFEEFEDESSTQSILLSIIDMLKAQAEESKAKAEAEAERSRATQAEYAAKAAENTLANKEEMIAMQAEKDTQKSREKEAKTQADLATYRYKKSRGMLDDANPTFESLELFLDVLAEEDIVTDERLLMRQRDLERKNLMAQLAAAENEEEKRAIQDQLNLLARKFQLKRQEAKARNKQRSATMQDREAEEENPNDRNQRQAQRNDQEDRMFEQVEVISEEEYNQLDEAVKRQFKRYNNKFVRKYRCYGGPKSGRIVTKPSDCGMRKDPWKVRRGKRAARMKKGQRIRKTQLAKRKAPSKRLVRMNKMMRGEK